MTVDEVRIDKVKAPLRQRLDDELKVQGSMVENAAVVAELTYAWLESRLPETLTLRPGRVRPKKPRGPSPRSSRCMVEYKAGVAELAPGGKPLDDAEIALLRQEYDAWVAQLGLRDRLGRSLATFGMYLALADPLRLLHLSSPAGSCSPISAALRRCWRRSSSR